MSTRLKQTFQNRMAEWSFASKKEYVDPFNEVEVSGVFVHPDGSEKAVPAFWAGGNVWRVRYASQDVGRHKFHIVCSDESNEELNSQRGILEVTRYMGKNPLFVHGPIRVSQDRRYLEHADGTPFFWLGDTWWMGLTTRLNWPRDFKKLATDRAKKGFTLVQIVAGLYSDMPPFDQRGANEAGFPWEEGFSRINPEYFGFMDRRIDWLVEEGIVPCIVGAWGYYIGLAGEETMKKHWRNLVARYCAYPVVWCLAGEAAMPYYAFWGEQRHKEQTPKARSGWTNVARYLRSTDPYHRPITVHPLSPNCGRNMVDDPSVIDIDMLQTGHSDTRSFTDTVNIVVSSVSRQPRLPVIVGEVCYEGIMGASWENVQRLMFWTSILNGAAGHTYGANGIWQVNTQDAPFGPSPHGQSWGDMPWDDACQLPGSVQLCLGKRLLGRYRWWLFEPHPEWVEPHWTKDNYLRPYAAGIPREVRIIYIVAYDLSVQNVKLIERDVAYNAFYFDPRTGKEYDLGRLTPDEKNEWTPPKSPIIQDFVLVIDSKDASHKSGSAKTISVVA